MKVKLYIDNNVWDELLKHQIDIAKELPITDYDLFITREAEFEIESMPESILFYAKKNIVNAKIKTDRIFGFKNPNLSNDEQRHGGFSSKFSNVKTAGRFWTKAENKIFEKERHLIGTQNLKTKLLKNEADVSLATRSAHSAILTCDNKKALKRASMNSGNVINLREWNSEEKSLSDFIRSKLSSKQKVCE
ncbi:hypothetical protein Rhein_3457 [Rheinheimera sp. A13L]|uniref:hypothetical protein n=1 Tax=Rheinheimera sp. A13L TaxID=506534 RepID=UPI0002124C4C|nr:hypothetical protein [Rheinheimera sp. A13L]EGM76395.1 hypothetical protein Rhein_3457 [Rheinheimera sp. A13L]